jgi:hypothetical protein
VVEAGRAMMWCGILVTLYTSTSRADYIIPLLVAIAGLLIYVLASRSPQPPPSPPPPPPHLSRARVAEVGRALMWCGILVTLVDTATRVVRVF